MVRALAFHQCGPGSNPGVDAIFKLSLLLVGLFHPRKFSLGTAVFPSPQIQTFLNSNSTRNQVHEEPLSGCATSKSLFIYFHVTRLSKLPRFYNVPINVKLAGGEGEGVGAGHGVGI